MLIVVLFAGMISESPLGAIKPWHDRLLMPLSGAAFTLLVALASGQPRNDELQRGQLPIERTMVWLGDRSYTMYLCPFPVMALVWLAIVVWAPWIFYVDPVFYGIVQAIPTVAITVLLADLTYRHVELPWNAVGEAISHAMVTKLPPINDAGFEQKRRRRNVSRPSSAQPAQLGEQVPARARVECLRVAGGPLVGSRKRPFSRTAPTY